jgi:NAD-dependent SIR2 family protein deacetylase
MSDKRNNPALTDVVKGGNETPPIKDQLLLLSKTKKVEINDQKLYVNGSISPVDDLTAESLKKLRETYTEWISHQPNFNLVVLSGAGTSYGIGKDGIQGKTLVGLWEDLEKSHAELIKNIISESKFDSKNKDLEALLTRAYRTYELNKDEKLKTDINLVEKIITANCSLEFKDADKSPHSIFLNKLIKRKVSLPRVKVITLNYDTLFEQAAAAQRFTLIDGFSFSNPRFFFGHSYDHDIVLRSGSRLKNEDNFIKKVFHLYKLHGSVDWLNNGKEVYQYPKEMIEAELNRDKTLKRVLIYPRDSKFELSYEQPYFDIIGRLQQSLKTENTLLITVGFSFCDKHIRSIIIESLKQNASLHLLAVTYPSIVDDKELQAFAKIDNRILLLAETFSDFANSFPDNISFSNDDPLDLIVTELAKRMKGSAS